MRGPTSAEEIEAVSALLRAGELHPVGRVVDASNTALLCDVVAPGDEGVQVIYKPVKGEQPLWDFPDGTLAGREVAAFLVAQAGGWGVVPPTVLRDGPLGPGSAQLWIGDPFDDRAPGEPVVDLVRVGQRRPGWLPVLDGQLPTGRRVTVVHQDRDDVRDAAVLDAVINNADRKGSHLVRDADGRLWGFDHGLTFHPAPKLRTVLWGWAGQPLRRGDVLRLETLRTALEDRRCRLRDSLAALLPPSDLIALEERVAGLLTAGEHPLPRLGGPAIPWPAL